MSMGHKNTTKIATAVLRGICIRHTHKQRNTKHETPTMTMTMIMIMIMKPRSRYLALTQTMNLDAAHSPRSTVLLVPGAEAAFIFILECPRPQWNLIGIGVYCPLSASACERGNGI